MRQFNNNGYRVVTIIVFGDQATACSKKCQPGAVLAVLNPKVLAPKPDQAQGFSIESETNLVPIGYS